MTCQGSTLAVVIPTYNRREKVLRAVESVLAQSVRPTELIVVDDCSTDDTVEALAAYPEVRVLKNTTNGGPSLARNQGARTTECEWISFLDSDDQWAPDYLAHVRSVTDNADSDVVLIYADTQYERSAWAAGASLLGGNIVGTCSAVTVRKQNLLELNGFDEKIRFAEDWLMWMALSRRGTVVHIRRPFVTYARGSEGSLTAKKGIRLRGYAKIRQARRARTRNLISIDQLVWIDLLCTAFILEGRYITSMKLICAMAHRRKGASLAARQTAKLLAGMLRSRR